MVRMWGKGRIVALILGSLLAGLVQAQDDITVYAAASLTNALKDIAKTYEASHPVKVKASFASSGTLAKQIEAGAPADIFASADLQWMDYLQQRKLINNASRKELLGNSLVLITPKDKPLQLTLQKGFNLPGAFEGRLCTGETGSVPVGIYAKEALGNLGWWSALEKRIVGTEDVRTALAFVERGECPLGIVYATDAKISDKVVVAGTFPVGSHKPVIYPFALLPKASQASREYFQYLQSGEAQAVFEKYGFTVRKP